MKKIFAMLVLAPAFALAAPTNTNRKTLQPMAKAELKGLSVFGSFDMTDTLDFDRSQANVNQSGTFGADKSFGFGGQYMLTQLNNGIGLEAGGTFELGRTLSNVKANGATAAIQGAKPEVQLWTVFGQASALLTQEIGLFGGANYSIPQVKNIPGGTWKGKMGWHIGGTYMLSNNFAVDGMYRTINFGGTADDQAGPVNYDNVRVQGFTFRARYLF